jgi:hypothetical protein
MAVFLNNKVGVKINSVDLSDHVTNITLNRNFDELEVTAMGDTAHRFVKGLEASSVTISFLNDTATASVLQTLQAAWGTSVAVSLLQDKNTAVSATNPLYTFNILVNKTTDINGAVGDMSTQDITFTINGATTVATTGTF